VGQFKALSLVIAGAIFCVPTLAPAQSADESALKAQFVYRFAQYTTWPSQPSSEFRLCLLGTSPVMAELEKLSDKFVSGVPLRVVRVAADKLAANECHLAFFGRSNPQFLMQWGKDLNNLAVLTISDVSEAYPNYAVIGLVTGPNRIAFKINRTQATAKGLVLSSRVLGLAKEVR
jgi:hypothetical protein